MIPEAVQVAGLALVAVAIAWAVGLVAAPSGFGWPAAIAACGVLAVGLGLLVERWRGGQ